MRIAVVNLKGGVGKTVSAVSLATGLAASGRTLLVDADPQGSALSWSEAAGDFPAVVVGLPVRDLPQRLAHLAVGYDHVVLDTPPGDAAIVASAILAATHVVVPIPPSVIDLDRLGPTVSLIADLEPQHPVILRVLLTRVRPRTRSATAIREALGELGLAVLAAEIPLREYTAMAFGLAPDVSAAYRAVLAELQATEVAA